MAKKIRRSKKKQNGNFSSIPAQIIWFIFGPLLGLLTYFTQIRIYLLENIGFYLTGLADGILISAISSAVFYWLILSRNKTLAGKEKNGKETTIINKKLYYSTKEIELNFSRTVTTYPSLEESE